MSLQYSCQPLVAALSTMMQSNSPEGIPRIEFYVLLFYLFSWNISEIFTLSLVSFQQFPWSVMIKLNLVKNVCFSPR